MLNNWETLKLDDITKKKLISLYNTVYPNTSWKMEKHGQQVGLFNSILFQHLTYIVDNNRNDHKLLVVQAFISLHQHFTPENVWLYHAPTVQEEKEQPRDMVDDPSVSGPRSSQSQLVPMTGSSQKDTWSSSSSTPDSCIPSIPEDPLPFKPSCPPVPEDSQLELLVVRPCIDHKGSCIHVLPARVFRKDKNAYLHQHLFLIKSEDGWGLQLWLMIFSSMDSWSHASLLITLLFFLLENKWVYIGWFRTSRLFIASHYNSSYCAKPLGLYWHRYLNVIHSIKLET